MEITEVRIALRDALQTRLKAYATLTFDGCFVVRNVKIIEGKNGLFVAMPSRKPKIACPTCHAKSDLGSRFCHQCAAALSPSMDHAAGAGDLEPQEAQAHRDIAHPVTAEFRHYLQTKVLEAYEAERNRGGASASGAAEGDYETLS
jgi:stage V sporulation protein G